MADNVDVYTIVLDEPIECPICGAATMKCDINFANDELIVHHVDPTSAPCALHKTVLQQYLDSMVDAHSII